MNEFLFMQHIYKKHLSKNFILFQNVNKKSLLLNEFNFFLTFFFEKAGRP